MKWLAIGLCALTVGCRRVPVSETAVQLEVNRLTLTFPRPEHGVLTFEVALPPAMQRAGALRWELFLGARRFAEGVVMAPEVVPDGRGGRSVRVEAPLIFRHTGWREGGTFLDVGLSGHLQPLVGAVRWPFRARHELLVNAAPVLDERAE
jgi:hypothetical protein